MCKYAHPTRLRGGPAPPFTPEMLEMLKLARELRKKGIIKF